MRLALAALASALVLAACGERQATAPAAPCLEASVVDLRDPKAGMVFIAGGSFMMGADDQFAEERPARRVEVADFWIARTEVTNRMFAAFVEATGYVTRAERGDEGDARIAEDERLPPGGVVFVSPTQIRGLADIGQWWRFVPGASWRTPGGPGTSIVGREDEPVVMIAHEDALAFARWRGHDLPNEAEWEFAARGGLEGAPYVWGAEFTPAGKHQANTWQGFFPLEDEGGDGHVGRAPVGCFAANGFGLYDMAGNVWEWTRDDAAGPDGFAVIKGGSFLCAPNFCARYRPAARQPGDRLLGTSHIGFRTVLRSGPAEGG